MKISHIINPVKVGRNSDLHRAQPVTFESMRLAAKFASGHAAVNLLAVSYTEDREVMPDGFVHLPALTQSVLDFIDPANQRKLPLISEILGKAVEAGNADYIIYTNVDIAVMPFFYVFVAETIQEGHDAFVINRRTISDKYFDVSDILSMYADPGEKHPGFDCFIFRREMYRNFYLGNACCGANWIGRVIISNLIAWSDKFKIFDNHHLTFHIGDDRSWKKPENYVYDRHNEKELEKTLSLIRDKGLLGKSDLMKSFLTQIERMNKKIPLYLHCKLSDNPVFIIGFTRSGTTLLQTLLATQKNVFSFPETHFFCEYLFMYLKFNSHGYILPECLDIFFEKAREYSGIDIEWYEIDFFKYLAGTGQINAQALFENIVKHYLVDQISPDHFQRIVWLEKTPFHGLAVDKILKLYPRARFINICRHPLPAIFSTKKNIHPDESFDFIARKFKRLHSSISEASGKYPGKLYSIRFEDMTANVEHTIAGVCKFLEIDFDADKLGDFHAKAVHTIKAFEKWKNMVFKPKVVNTDNTEFLEKMPLNEILSLQHMLRDEMRANSYKIYFPEKQNVFEQLIA